MSDQQITARGTDLTVLSARTERDQLADRTDVIDRVGVLRALPGDMFVTTEMAAEFYQVSADTIRTAVKRNREEFDSDGLDVVDRDEFALRFNVNLSRSSYFMVFPRRAVVRLGMLLRDSEPARRVRDYLLDVEAESAPAEFVIPRTLPEALRAYAAEVESHELTKLRNAELEPKASLADNYLTAQGGARLVREVAKTFGMKEHQLRTFLLDEKLIFARHAPCGDVQYDHYASHAHYFLPREKVVQHQWGSCTHYTLTILPRGVELISKRLSRAA